MAREGNGPWSTDGWARLAGQQNRAIIKFVWRARRGPEEVAWVHQVVLDLTEQACRGGTYLKTDLKSETQGMAGKHKTL